MRHLLTILVLVTFQANARQVTAICINGQVNAPDAQNLYLFSKGDVLIIPATATYVNIGNAHDISIVGQGSVLTSMELRNLTDVKVADIRIEHSRYRGAQLFGMKRVTFTNVNLYDIADYGWYCPGPGADITWKNCSVRKMWANPWVIGFNAGDNIQRPIFDSCRADSVMVGSVWVLEQCFKTIVRNCTAVNTGLNERGHTAVVFLRGDGKIYNNFFYNFWGDAFRLFGIGLNKDGLCEVWGNTATNSRKYGGVEVNTQPADTIRYRPAAYHIWNNTLGDFAAVDYYPGGGTPFDIYYSFRPVIIENNRWFNSYSDKPFNPAINYLWHDGNNTTKPILRNNIQIGSK